MFRLKKVELARAGKTLHHHKRAEREKIRELLNDQQKEYVNFELCEKHPDSNVPDIDITMFSSTIKPISRGGEGTVFLLDLPGRLLKINEELVTVAAKKFEFSPRNNSAETVADVERRGHAEIVALHKLRHRNIVQMLGRGTLHGEKCLLLEFCPGSLDAVLKNIRDHKEFLPPTFLVPWIMDIALGLRYVHGKGRCHGDIKPANILLAHDKNTTFVAKLADFGLSQAPLLRDGSVSCHRGTARYMTPEQHNGERIDPMGVQRCDVWAYGIVIWEMITCLEPFAGVEDQIISSIIGAKNEYSHPALPSQSNLEQIINLLRRCWSSKSIDRQSFYEISSERLTSVSVDIQNAFPSKESWYEECRQWVEAESARTYRQPTIQ
ncbi:hypothetical protein PMAYCL1PPCAC_19882 [Pristionchus mayeri]|uniref:Protein kinase domain-containing protein n=1 Tax=Pristionchus mayeri TaxID=1317129 RepID=A0AAN5CTA7_9BILA|nr:hypothetical protein PMAYCL1PPCAC_19882 [Pristionchus mayeri]